MPEPRRTFSPHFKAEALPVAKVARNRSIHVGILGNWVNAWRREYPEPDQVSCL